MKSTEDIVRPLRDAVSDPKLVSASIQSFLRDYWAVPDQEVADEAAWDILGELAADLEYFEADPNLRSDKCLLDEERAMKTIRGKLAILDTYYGEKKTPNQSLQPTAPSGRG